MTSRILSNYIRLALTMMLGLALVPLLLHSGDVFYGIIVIIGSTLGLGAILQDIIGKTMIAELGAAYHSRNQEGFRRIFSAASFLSRIVAFSILVLSVLICIMLPSIYLIPEDFLWAARLFVVTSGLQTVSLAITAPFFNILLIQERFILWNFWLVVRRAVFLIAGVVIYAFDEITPDMALAVYGVLSTILFTASLVLSTIQIKHSLPQVRFFGGEFSIKELKSLIQTGGWNILAQLSLAFHPLFGAFMMNRFYGVSANSMFAVALQFAGYIRMTVSGIASGIDAISARINMKNNRDDRIRLIQSNTLLHGLAAFPAMTVAYVMAEPLLLLWIGPQFESGKLDFIVTLRLFYVLGLGCLGQGLSDGLIKILYGAGQVRGYALALFATVLMNPLIIFATLCVLPEQLRIYALVLPWSVLMVVFSLLVLPFKVSQWTESHFFAVLKPFLKPLLSALLASPILYIFQKSSIDSLGWNTLTAIVSYLLLYSIVIFLVVLGNSSREKVIQKIRRLTT